MPSHVNLKTKDLSKFSPRAIRCLKEWEKLTVKRLACPFHQGADPYGDESTVSNFKCRNFCFKVFPFKVINGEYRKCPCQRLSQKYVIATVRAIIKLKEAEHG